MMKSLLSGMAAVFVLAACGDISAPDACATRSPRLEGTWTTSLQQHELSISIDEQCTVHFFESSDTTLAFGGSWQWNGLSGEATYVGRGGGQPGNSPDSAAIMLFLDPADNQISRRVVVVAFAYAAVPAGSSLRVRIMGTFTPPNATSPVVGSFTNQAATLKRR